MINNIITVNLRQQFEFDSMDNTDMKVQPIEMPDVEYEQLEQPPPLDQKLTDTLDSNITNNNWIQSHYCITMVRQIIKQDPKYISDIINRYSNAFVDLFNNGKTQIIKNLLRMVKQIFDHGKSINVQKAVYAFLPVLLKKSCNDLGHIKEMSQTVLTAFSNNCGYDISFTIASGYCCDKNKEIAEISVKLLARLIQNIGSSIIHLNPQTLQNIMKNLSGLVDGKRQNLRNQGLDICLYVYNLIGSQNYLSLMNYSLKNQEINSMGISMQQHRTSKNKPVPLMNVLKQRRSMAPQRFNNGNMYFESGMR